MSHTAPVRLLFMGSDAIALPTLEYLHGESSRVCIQTIYTQPDRARGRGKKVKPNAIKTWAGGLGIPVHQPNAFGESELSVLREINPDLILVMAYGHILPQPVLDVPPLGIYNLHTSLLPRLRGPSPIETAVASGMAESGVSLMKVVLKMDAGPVCDQERMGIAPLETGGSYREKLSIGSRVLVERNLSTMLEGSLEAISQDEDAATYCRLLVKQDGRLDFNESARKLAHRINGLNPWPGCFTELDGMTLKVGRATWLDQAVDPLMTGVVVTSDARGVFVSTGEGLLQFLELQKPGGKMLPVELFLRGNAIAPGTRFVCREMHGLISKKPVSHKRVFQLYEKP